MMMKHNAITPSPESQQEALKIAKATQKPGQTKEQTKLIAQGIEKGIALYKKQQKEKHRQADRARKKQLRDKSRHQQQEINDYNEYTLTKPSSPSAFSQYLPWGLLVISWVGFVLYTFAGR
ncbi:DUF2956 domain-containing protein [Vibrio vulnificus]|nr:DUF2956 domain-containing protein [Vibrio vulnificus]EHK2772249.1 DUF2956 domain-containing protein [Vibrio vulnificus]ELX4132844.1 DUF2956 domain-containing protein [Vibrio vulnificus]ELX4179191.1 DUF2956 domain-containing protein [Vibrio vulnificus]